MRRALTLALMLLGLKLGLAGGAAAESLLLYTSQPDRIAAETVAAFSQAHPGTRIELFRSGTTEVMNRLQAEFAAGAPRPDLLLIADAVAMAGLKREGRLLALPAQAVDGLPAWSYDPERTYFGTKLITTGIAYNTAAPRPQSWRDLLAPAAKGRVVLPSPLYSGAALLNMAALAADPGLGPGFYGALAANGAVAAAGNGTVMSAVAGGQKTYGILVDFMALNAKAKGSPIDFVFPVEGVSAVTEPVAILKTATHPAEAEAFVAFLLSPEGQALARRQGFLALRPEIPLPPGFPARDALKLLPVDPATALSQAEALKRDFAASFGG